MRIYFIAYIVKNFILRRYIIKNSIPLLNFREIAKKPLFILSNISHMLIKITTFTKHGYTRQHPTVVKVHHIWGGENHMKKTLLIIIVLSLINLGNAMACSMSASGRCAGAACDEGEVCKKVSDFECQCQKSSDEEKTHLPTDKSTWALEQLPENAKDRNTIKHGCCGQKSSGHCAASVLKTACPSDYQWKRGKACHEYDKTGCLD